MEDKVQCQICKKHFKWITPTHLKMHGLTFQEYKDLYPDAEMMASDVLAKRLESAKKRRLTPEQKHRCGNGSRGRVQTEEEKEKRRKSCLPLSYTPEINKRRSDTMKAVLADGSVVSRTNKTKAQRRFLIRFFGEMRMLEQFAYGNLIQCEICGAYRENIGASHLKSHGITLTEYKRMYPLAKTVTKKYIEKLSSSIKGVPKRRSLIPRRVNETTKIKSAIKYFKERCDKIDGLLRGDLIECKICGEIIGQLSGHIVRKHGVTVDQYKKMYPNDLTVAPNLSEVMSNENTKKWDNSEYKREVSEKISATSQGISYDEWESFASRREYCPKFNEACRESNRDKYDRRCFLCDKQESKNISQLGIHKRLSVHHVDMNKNQGCDGIRWKLIPVCLEHHSISHTKLWKARIEYLLNNVWSINKCL